VLVGGGARCGSHVFFFPLASALVAWARLVTSLGSVVYEDDASAIGWSQNEPTNICGLFLGSRPRLPDEDAEETPAAAGGGGWPGRLGAVGEEGQAAVRALGGLAGELHVLPHPHQHRLRLLRPPDPGDPVLYGRGGGWGDPGTWWLANLR